MGRKILFITTDQQRFDALGCNGGTIARTPVIDRLAAEGLNYSRAYNQNTVCMPARSTMISGQYVRSHGVVMNGIPLPTDGPDVAAQLRDQAGYRTALFGKWHAKMPKGFKPADHFVEYEKIFRSPYFKEMPDGSKRHTTELIADRGIKFLRTQKGRKEPFCLNLWFNAGHAEDRDRRPGIGHFPWPKAMNGKYDDIEIPTPRLSDPAIYAAHPEFLKQSNHRERFHWRWDTPEKYQQNMRAYFRMLTGIDHVMDRVLKALEQEGLAENTIIVYTADNGFYMGDRGFAGKWSHHEQSLRVPLVIYDPRLPKNLRGRTIDTMALNLDLPATFLDWGGVRIPASYQGTSLKPLIESKVAPAEWREDFFCEHFNPRYRMSWEGVRGKRFKYARYLDQDPVYEFLHDLKNDPDELTNLATDPKHASVLRRLQQKTDALAADYAEALTN